MFGQYRQYTKTVQDFSSKSLRKASHVFLSITPSSGIQHTVKKSNLEKKEYKLTIRLCVGNYDVSRSKLHEELVEELQWGVGVDSQRRLYAMSANLQNHGTVRFHFIHIDAEVKGIYTVLFFTGDRRGIDIMDMGCMEPHVSLCLLSNYAYFKQRV
jgi:hypothetical protein